MSFRLYNTMSKRIEPFLPADPGCVTFYTCGPTVYDDAHIGNFRSFLAADLLRRWLESPLCTLTGPDGSPHSGPRAVIHVMNITDVGHMTDDADADGGGEDKMVAAAARIREAKKAGKLPENAAVDPDDPRAVAEFYRQRFLEDAKALGLKVAIEAESDPTLMPRATGHIEGMQRVIGRLLDAGAAYTAGRPGARAIYFDVKAFEAYGRLSGNTLDRLRGGAGGRVDESTQQEKRHPADFLLWKEDPSHKMKWDAPDHPSLEGWGPGYPGWHIECTAMALDRLLLLRSSQKIRNDLRAAYPILDFPAEPQNININTIRSYLPKDRGASFRSQYSDREILMWAIAYAYSGESLEKSHSVFKSHTQESVPTWQTIRKRLSGLDLVSQSGSSRQLGIDLHSGGEDNIFPHHECEIAQSCAFTGADRFARHWFHPRFLMVNGQKMSKSKGTFFTPRELMAKGIDPAAIRLELIKTHYRANADFSLEGLGSSIKRINRLRSFAKRIGYLRSNVHPVPPGYHANLQAYSNDFAIAISDDLNIAKALSIIDLGISESAFSFDDPLDEWRKLASDAESFVLPDKPIPNDEAWAILQGSSESMVERNWAALHLVDNILGIIFRPVQESQNTGIAVYLPGTTPSEEIESLLAERRDAKKAKDFARSDAIRDELASMGYAIKDMPGGKVEVGPK
ncbi:MAG: hypothetical protein LAT64_05105 [Phycisphaerales bacterium]|nr:hypothetical protein [Planctomycetota bacterium]MCH8508134.1 hypothetical protein [Phycisphaerales bacterium]